MTRIPRIALDVSKAASRDGLGSYTRGLVHGLVEFLVEEEGGAEFLLVNLLGADSAEDLEHALGVLPEAFTSDLGRWAEKTAGQQEALLSSADALLALSWSLPAAAPPSLFVVYDLTFLTHPQCHTLHNRLHCAEGLLRARLHHASLAAISTSSADELKTHVAGADAPVVIAPPGLGEAFQPATGDVIARVRARHALGDIEGYVLSVGSFEPRKNLLRLVEAHRQLEEPRRHAYPLCMVGGGGWRQDELQRQLDDDDPKAVRRLGAVSEADLVDLFSAATVFVYPSLAEGFGLPVLEAMACGAPVITSNLSSLPEVAGDAAVLVDPADTAGIAGALNSLLSDTAARTRMRKRGLERARLFPWRATAATVLAELRRLAAT